MAHQPEGPTPVTDEELTAAERAAIREILKSDARRQWLISGVTKYALWLGGLSTAYLAFREVIRQGLFGV